MTAWIVAGAGPSLSEEVARQCRGFDVIAVNDAWRRFPDARILYACDQKWWCLPHGRYAGPPNANEFVGERWTCYGAANPENEELAKRLGLKLIEGKHEPTFSFTPGLIHYGGMSGFQAINLVLNQFGATHVVLVGFDLKNAPNGDSHFFGHHAAPLVDPDNLIFDIMKAEYRTAADALPPGIRIVNATPGSAITSFPMLPLEEALNEIRSLSALRTVPAALNAAG